MNIFLLNYLIISMVHISFRSENMKYPSAVSKVLLMPSLLAYYFSITTDTGVSFLLIPLALVVGTLGDAFLLAGHTGKRFYAGMFCFLIGHLTYITYFILHVQSWVYFLSALLLLAFPLYKIIRSLFPSQDALLLSIYATVLILLTAFCASSLSYIAMVGALFFALSDYLIAMDIVGKRTFSETAIMGTYTLAQLLLIVGVLSLQGVF